MKDNDCVQFLQWALPLLRMRWPGFRKVRKQVCKRITRRMRELDITDTAEYRNHLATHPVEWQQLDRMCRVVVTRFYRDRLVFATLAEQVLPALANAASASGESALRCWCIGCASGEEPYTLSILWRHLLAARFPTTNLAVVATEIDAQLLERARRACYPLSAVKNLPPELRAPAFVCDDDLYCLRPAYQTAVEFRLQDVRIDLPPERFHLILCRNLAFTYFDTDMQRELLDALYGRLLPGGWLVLGVHEVLPAAPAGLVTVSARLGLYQSRPAAGVNL